MNAPPVSGRCRRGGTTDGPFTETLLAADPCDLSNQKFQANAGTAEPEHHSGVVDRRHLLSLNRALVAVFASEGNTCEVAA